MNKSIVTGLRAFAVAAAVLAIVPTSGAEAQEIQGKKAGDFNVRFRGISVNPDNAARPVNNASTGALVSTLEKAQDSMTVEVDVSYFVTRNIALELIAATTNHNLTVGAPALNNGTDLGRTGVLPPTLTLQFHPLPNATFSPYAGAGLNYTFFYNESNGANFNGLKLKDTWGWALQAGLDIQTSSPWSLNFDIKKIFLTTSATVSQNPNTALTVTDIKLDPWVFGAGIGYKF
jgi:outer membrane protein